MKIQTSFKVNTMEEQRYSIPGTQNPAMANGEIVPIFVDYDHPLLQLKRALPWEAIEEVMVRRWKEAGKNIDGGPGCLWDVSLYVPLLVLKFVKGLQSRQMEEYLSENGVARIFVSRHNDPTPQIRDHSNIARAQATLGKEGVEEVNALVLKVSQRFGFADPSMLSSDTTAQELPIGYPNEPGILGGIAKRCSRALENLKNKGVQGVESVIDLAKKVVRSVKEHHLFAKDKEEKQKVLGRIIEETKTLITHTLHVTQSIKQSKDRVIQAATTKLQTMKEVVEQLIPQILHWIETGKVAKGKILHAGILQARAIVRNKIGKKVEFGLKYLINRIGGGYLFCKRVLATAAESKMPLLALACYRQIFGAEATPELFSYDRGGWAKSTAADLKKEGVEQIGIQPKGKAQWLVAEEVQKTVRSERGKTEGTIGTLKSKKYGFNRPLERKWEMLEMAGPSSVLSFNFNKLMRDLVRTHKEA
jgi:hypothetical protein